MPHQTHFAIVRPRKDTVSRGFFRNLLKQWKLSPMDLAQRIRDASLRNRLRDGKVYPWRVRA
jgi:hypothetical protein